MKRLMVLVLIVCLAAAARAGEADELRNYIEGIVREYTSLGKKPFETRWPSGQTQEKYEPQPDGTLSYSKLFPAGGYAIKFQKKPSKAIYYERWYGNGKTREVLNYDDRTIAYTSYFEDGTKRQSLKLNKLTKEKSYQRFDKNGKQVTP
ncbi:hypothetical protein DYH09_28305 [bacterium CPR1]|nr:hypothetical protein [bacterium CPR1]